MPRQRTFHLVLVLAALGLLLLIFYPRHPREDAPPEIAPPLPRGGGARVVAIEKVTATDTLRLIRAEGMWHLREPIRDLGSLRMVRELLRATEELEVVRFIRAESLGVFGLDPPRVRLRLMRHGGEVVEILTGTRAPTSGGAYVTWEGVPGVVLTTPQFITRFMDVGLFEWREREMLPPSRAGIDSVWVAWDGGRARLARLAHEEWLFLEPAGLDADGLACERTVAAFWRFPFTRFLDDPAEAARAGLDPPRATWWVFRADRCDTLYIGDRVSDEEMAVQLAGRSPGLIRDDLFVLLTGGARALEARRLFWAEPHAVVALALIGPGGGAYLEREGGDWYARALTQPEIDSLRAGVRPRTARNERVPWRDPSLAGDLINLLSMQSPGWLDSLRAPARVEAFPLQIHLWDRAGALEWAGVRDPQRSQTPAAVGHRHPRQPLEVPPDLYQRWTLRRERVRERVPGR